MKKALSLLAIAAFIFYSCQKDLSTSQERPLGGRPGLLQKTVTFNYPDSTNTIVETYNYDDNGRLISGAYDFGVFRGYTHYYRDAAGRIIKIAAVNSTGSQDTVFTFVNYTNATSDRVTFLSDSSAVFFYSADGKVIRTNTYKHFPLSTDPMKLVIYHLYSYDARGNLSKREEYTDRDNNGSFELNFTYFLEYDDKVNPFYPLDDVTIENHFLFRSPNNLIKQKNDPVDPLGTDDENISVYDYRADKKPNSALFMAGDGRKTKTLYYYY